MESVLSVNKLSKSYGTLEAVKAVSFEVAPKEIFALIGPNGAGKSTTIRMIATILSPTKGSASICGLDLATEADKIREVISYLPEEAGAYKNMTGIDYFKFMAALYTNDNIKQREYVENAEDISELGKRLRDKIGSYSKGMTRKLLLSRTVMMNPKLAILDEPTSGLDVVNAMEIRRTIKALAKGGMSVLLSSHNMLEIEYLADRIAIIEAGKIRDTGTAHELRKKHNASNLEEVFMAVSKRSEKR